MTAIDRPLPTTAAQFLRDTDAGVHGMRASPTAPEDVIGAYTIAALPFLRRASIEGFAAVPQGHHMLALLELDVTLARAAVRDLQAEGTRVSLFAFVLQSVATALAEHPELNVVRDGRRVVRFEDVDVNVPVEVDTTSGAFPRPVVVRHADRKSAAEIYAEIDLARSRHATAGATGAEDRRVRRLMKLGMRLPGPLRRWIIRRLAADPFTAKRVVGTTFLTSVGKFADVPGFVVPYVAGPLATSFAAGSVVEKPVVREGRIAIRSILSFTIAFNHDLVDGAPAARFARRLQALVEGAESLRMPAAARP